jgi:hypothetical protein
MTTTIESIRLRALGRSRGPGRLEQIQTSVRESVQGASRTLHDPRSRRHQRAAARHLRRASRRAQRIGLGNAVGDSRVKWQVWRGYRHMVAAAKPPPRRGVRRVVAGGVLAGLVVGGTAAGIARVRPGAGAGGDDSDPAGDRVDGVEEPPA